MKRRLFLRRSLTAAAAGLGIALLVGLGRGLFRVSNTLSLYRELSNAFLAAGVLLLCWGALRFCARQGFFSILSFAGRRFLDLFSRDLNRDEDHSYYTIRKKSMEKQRPMAHLLLAGALHILLSLLFTLLFLKQAG